MYVCTILQALIPLARARRHPLVRSGSFFSVAVVWVSGHIHTCVIARLRRYVNFLMTQCRGLGETRGWLLFIFYFSRSVLK